MNKRKKFLGQYVVVSSFLLVLLLSLVGGFATQIVKTIQYNKEIAQLKSNIKNVDKEIKDLKKDKQRLDNDKYIEDIARQRLKMVKSNEIIYIDINKGSK
ncbi:FtsB family cell division protein [Paraclostridium sordellii]|uniref:FtsB family cell division protein n=1 Tax=Paraclostridium sordellii TaxID=1505 RepID=UPI0003859D45|nr:MULTISPECIES: septum formation initiator family protein [Paeniclostridium]EPZ54384.1 septum formation initiator family protein [[Clostridium] sordellii VPI 9048] [Paeniclostridium sordellii VPI 9048]MBW4864406.1 septum formation initiator family protein [Paeniclostridium sp.]MBW4873727.1 septum formation initiator family protein [Paeniclostridium sp.]MCH1964739.1 septum formation initiator family protein [Paeniclostridium sordellii]MDU1455875.1 septum formation initiator family protein [Pae